MKVLGTKVNDDFYFKFSELGNISEHLRIAAEMYLKSKVNHTETPVNRPISENGYKRINKDKLSKIHRFLTLHR